MTLDLEAIKARAEAATEGPWRENKPLSSNGWVDVTSGVVHIATCYLSKADEDAEFIAHARTDIPALITEIEHIKEMWRAAEKRDIHKGAQIRSVLELAQHWEETGNGHYRDLLKALEG